MTAYGSEDQKIRPEGLLDYKVFPPLEIQGPNETPEVSIPEATETIEEIFNSKDIDIGKYNFGLEILNYMALFTSKAWTFTFHH